MPASRLARLTVLIVLLAVALVVSFELRGPDAGIEPPPAVRTADPGESLQDPPATDARLLAAREAPAAAPIAGRANTAVPTEASAPRAAAAVGPGRVERTVCYVRVLDSGTGEPLEGAFARVRVTAHRDWSAPAADALRSDALGVLRLEAGDVREEWVDVHVPGYGPSSFPLAYASGSLVEAPTVSLRRAATLVVRVTPLTGSAIPGARVSVLGRGFPVDQPARATGPLGELAWSGTTDAQGMCVIAELPAGVQLSVAAGAGDALVGGRARAVELEPGERRVLDFTVGGGATVRGTLRRVDGTPVECDLWLVPASKKAATFFEAGHEPGHVTRSSEHGLFRFDDVGAGAWWIGPAPAAPGGAPAPFAEWLSVAPEGGEQVLHLTAHTALHVAGLVVGPDGASVDRAALVLAREGGGVVQTRSAADGSFRAGPLAPGTYSVTAHHVLLATSAAVQAQAGDDDVHIVLRAGGDVRIALVDELDSRPLPGTLLITGERTVSLLGVEEDPRSEFEVKGLAAGVYAFTGRTADGRVGVLIGVDVGPRADLGELRLPLARGASLDITYRGEADRAVVRVFWKEALVGLDVLLPAQAARFVVPPGEAVVEWSVGGAGPAGESAPARRFTLRVSAGDVQRVTLPRPL